MSYCINDKLSKLTPYAPLTGEYPVRLDANESYFPMGERMSEKIAEAVKKVDFNRYPDPYAKEVCALFAAYYGIQPETVTAGNGSDELIGVLVNAFLEKGDRLVVTEPDFSMYAFYAYLNEVECIAVPKDDDMRVDVAAVLEAVRQSGARAVMLSNPCNPTSLGLCREEVRRLVEGTDALVILDEAYMDFWDQSFLAESAEYDNLVVLKTCSKAFGMAALRLGFAVAGGRITTALRAAKSPYNVNAVTQAAAKAVLSDPAFLKSRTAKLVNARRFLEEELRELAKKTDQITRIYASCTNFVFFSSPKAEDIYAGLLECGIAVRKMGTFIRVTAGGMDENRAFLSNLQHILTGEEPVR